MRMVIETSRIRKNAISEEDHDKRTRISLGRLTRNSYHALSNHERGLGHLGFFVRSRHA